MLMFSSRQTRHALGLFKQPREMVKHCHGSLTHYTLITERILNTVEELHEPKKNSFSKIYF